MLNGTPCECNGKVYFPASVAEVAIYIAGSRVQL